MGRRRFSSGRGRVLVVSVVVLGSVTALWLLLGNRGPEGVAGSRPGEGTPVSVDRPAPTFAQPLLSGDGSLSLGRFDGQVVVVNFWASWCTACRTEGPDLGALSRSYRAQGVRFIGVDYRDSMGSAIDFARSHGMTYPSVSDPKGTIGDAYGIFGLPTTFIVAPDGRIRYVINGRIHVASFSAALESVLGTTATGSSGT